MHLLVWLYPSSPARPRLGQQRQTLAPEAVYTAYIKRELLRVGCDGGLDLDDSARNWYQAFMEQGGRVRALALVRARRVASVADVLSDAEQAMHDYWSATRFYNEPFQTISIVKIMSLETPEFVHVSATQSVPRALFFKMTPVSFTRLVNSRSASGPCMKDIVGQWQALLPGVGWPSLWHADGSLPLLHGVASASRLAGRKAGVVTVGLPIIAGSAGRRLRFASDVAVGACLTSGCASSAGHA